MGGKMVYRLGIKTNRVKEMINITLAIQNVVRKSKVTSGTVLVFIPHTTASIIITENTDPDLLKDILWKYSELVPRNTTFDHLEGNSDSHILSTLVGNSVQLIIAKNSLWLGSWQSIYYVELDGPKGREIWVKITADSITEDIPDEVIFIE
jgi:secondary thiamine-phosphate synthase enzyme